MFRWDFAKSAEAMLSRWAIKRLCKFLLKKKKLGDYIDLDQLDVQLTEGAIQLRDLALNVDFINQKLGETPIFVKEGTIVSLMIKIPWKMRNCQIEVEDLELVVAPCGGCSSPTDTGICLQNSDGKESKRNAPEKIEQGVGPGNLASSSLDVHEGVKTIAKIVKWFLTSFNIRVRNFIVAFDPCSDRDDTECTSHRNLVLRIAEIEYGTCVSEDATSKLNSLLGIAKLTNFIKFHGAAVEFLEMEDLGASESSFNEHHSKNSPSGSACQVLSGADGGFSGILNLSIPWKNGSLDIHKVDADISIDPVKLCLQPSTIRWIIFSWESLKNVNKVGRSHVDTTNTYTVHQSYTSGTIHLDTNRKTSSKGFFSLDIDSQMNQVLESSDLPSPTYIIQNWVTSDNGLRGHAELEPDYGASIDQFFECFDEMRSSHASLGNSGIWNWTCSVFSAITAASSLASESGFIPYEQQYMETNLKAKVSAVSVVLSFDDQTNCSQHPMGNYRQMEDLYRTVYDTFSDSLSQTVHYVESKFQDLVLSLQICPKGTEVEVTIRHIKVDDFLSVGSEAERLFSMVSHLQAGVQSTLPPRPFSNSESDAKSDQISSNSQSYNESFRESCSTIPKEGSIKVQLLESFGTSYCRYSLSSANPSNKSAVSSSCSAYLPQFILWVDFTLVNMLMSLFKQVDNSLKDVKIKESKCDASEEKRDASSQDVSRGTCIKAIPPRGSLRGDIFLPHSRIILCFPSDNVGDSGELYCWSSFIGFEISSLSSGDDKACATVQPPNQAYLKGHSHTPSTSVHFHNGPLNIYLITSSRKDALVSSKSYMDDLPSFVSKKILSITGGRNDHHPAITMLWQKGPVTGPWMAKRAWSLATLQNPRNWRKVTGKGDEFVSVRKAEDLEEMGSQVRQELILNSAFLLHICLPQVWIDLSNHEYRLLYHLLNEVQDGLSFLRQDKDTAAVGLETKHPFETDDNASQAAVLVECNLLDIRITLDEVMEISRSLQKELAGSWNSLKLTIRKFELLSVSSVGGLSSDNFLWLGHDEGDLWGSIVNTDDSSTSASSQDLLLITCRNSMMKRGDGEGGNILCSGSAGTSITHLSNQQLFQSFTSINVRCATVIAPGGRLDWFGAICLYFSPPHEIAAENDNMENEISEGISARRQLFLLNLVDVALSYEPYQKSSEMSLIVPAESHTSAKPSDESSEQNVACLLAAASLNLFNEATGNAADGDYNIQIQDIGLLICEQSGLKTEMGNYSVDYLQENDYVKIAKEALVDAILRTNCQNGLLWELELSDSHVNVGTCHDTTSGLVHLFAQLQQLFAPDVEDALVHLQSRWDSVKRTHDENEATSAANVQESSVGLAPYEESSSNDENTAYTGLMDEILDNAFCYQGKQATQTDLSGMQSDGLPHHGMPKVRYNMEISNPAAGDLSFPNVSFSGSILQSVTENIQDLRETNMCLPQLIERYYISELLPQSKSSGSCSSAKVCRSESNVTTNRDAECVKGGWYNDSPLIILENHISAGSDNTGGKQSHQQNELPFVTTPLETCIARGRILLKNLDVRWRMFSGCDWPKTQKSSVCSSSSEIRRDENECLELMLSGLNLQYDFYPDGELFVSKLSLSVQDFYVHDRCRNAPWRMVLGYYHSKNHSRESSAKAFKLDLESVKPDPSTPLEEYRLHFAFLPLRLHLHQGQLNFLLSFFGDDSPVGPPPNPTSDVGGTQIPMTKNRSVGGQDIVEEALLPFFQKFDIYPSIVRVDYIPHHVDMAALRGGNYVQLINLVPWKGIDIQLKPVHAVGVYGWGSVCETVVGDWLEDISHNQVHKILKGLTPVRSFFSVSSGAAKLVSLPVKTYKKDHRLLKGIQRGAIAFLRSVSLEAVGLGVHLAGGAHDLLIQTEHILTRIPPSVPFPQDSMKASVRCNQPKNARHGIQQAYESLSDGFGKTASALVGTPLKRYQRGAGAGSAFASVIQGAPVAAVTPASAVFRALHCTFLGVRNSLDPEHKKESVEKYLGSSRS